jgi:hypothetical protein
VTLPRDNRVASRRLLIGLAAGMLVFGAAQLPELVTLQNRGAGIVAFELARTSGRAHQITSEWGSRGRSAAGLSLIFDYGFLIFYGLLLAATCTAVAKRAQAQTRVSLARLGRLLAIAALVAALADAFENAALLFVSSGHTSQPFPGIAFGFAALKFTLLAPVLVYALLGWPLTRRVSSLDRSASSRVSKTR